MSEIMLIALGAALMYFFDPGSGRQRRAWLRDQWDRLAKKGLAAAPTTTAPRYTATEQSVAAPTDSAAAPPTDEAFGGRQGGEIAEEPGDAAKNTYKHE